MLPPTANFLGIRVPQTWPLHLVTLMLFRILTEGSTAADIETTSVLAVASRIFPVVIRYYQEPGCPECIQVSEDVMPQIEKRFAGRFVLLNLDTGIMSNYVELVRYQESFKKVKNEPVYMVLDGECILSGIAEIKGQLPARLAELTERETGREMVKESPLVAAAAPSSTSELIARRFETFTLPMVLAAGLIDGINPCAISTLVFFMSLLAVSRVEYRRLVLMGISFCFASFVTYTALGFGLLRVLHLFSGFVAIRRGIDLAMVAILSVFAVLSFRDALRYRATGRARDITLQLPDKIKVKIHGFMKRGIGMGSLIVGGLFVGASVTAFESVCTGQVYVPTLVLVVKGGGSALRSVGYLLFYNAMFVLPLVTIFALTLAGLKTKVLLDWSRKNVVLSKMLLGCCFVLMAVLISVI